MSLKMVLFDLDGTLLPMEQESFVKSYFGRLSRRLTSRGFEPKELIQAIWKGTETMIRDRSERTNEEVFWDTIAEIYGEEVRKEEPYFDEFYVEEFDCVSESCGHDPQAARTVADIKSRGLRVALATNPIFPSIATEKRMGWAGFSTSDFEYYTTYENSSRCKPNPEYYTELMAKLGVAPSECLMVGNDVNEDMIAEKLGMKVFLMTDFLLNKDNKDISVYRRGGYKELIKYVDELLETV